MRVLMPISGFAHSGITIQECLKRSWPAGTQVEVLSIPPAGPRLSSPLGLQRKPRAADSDGERERARFDAETAAEKIRQNTAALEVSAKVLEGRPADAILKEAEDWGSDLILMGSHAYGVGTLLFRGSIARAVAARAKCRVEIVRKPTLARCA